MSDAYNTMMLKICAWCGPGFVALFLIGVLPVSWFFPPHSAADTAAETVFFYTNGLTGIQLGCVLMFLAGSIFAPWGLAIAYATSRSENGFPILFYTQVVSVAISAIIVLLIPLFWAVASFRAGVASPDVTQSWNDGAWLGVLFTWPPFAVWNLAIGAAILADKSANPLMDRWLAYFNFWAAFLYTPGSLMIFFKTGAFSQNGIITFWVPIIMFFTWVTVMSWAVFKAIARDTEGKLTKSTSAMSATTA